VILRSWLIRLLPDVGPAREHPAFRRLLVGGLLSALGSSMTSFAVVLAIWDLTHSSLAVGLLGLTFVPVLAVGLLGGSIADAVDRRKLALVTSGCLMAVSAAFAVQAYARSGQLWLLYALAMVQAVLQAASAPARGTFMPRLVPPEQLTAAISLNTLTGRITISLARWVLLVSVTDVADQRHLAGYRRIALNVRRCHGHRGCRQSG
jgi:MFS family permease